MDVHEMWRQCSQRKVKDVARSNGLTTQALVALFDQAGLTGRQQSDPGPAEIAAAAALIRKEWTPEVERARWVAAHTIRNMF